MVMLPPAAAGLAIAVHLALLTYDLVPGDSVPLPRICGMRRSDCRSVLGHPDARLLGLPTAVCSIGSCGPVVAQIMTGDVGWLRSVVAISACITIGFGAYIVSSFFSRVKVFCTLRMITHRLNVTIALLALREVMDS